MAARTAAKKRNKKPLSRNTSKKFRKGWKEPMSQSKLAGTGTKRTKKVKQPASGTSVGDSAPAPPAAELTSHADPHPTHSLIPPPSVSEASSTSEIEDNVEAFAASDDETDFEGFDEDVTPLGKQPSTSSRTSLPQYNAMSSGGDNGVKDDSSEEHYGSKGDFEGLDDPGTDTEVWTTALEGSPSDSTHQKGPNGLLVQEYKLNEAEIADAEEFVATMFARAKVIKEDAAKMHQEIDYECERELGKTTELREERESKKAELRKRNDFLRLLIHSS